MLSCDGQFSVRQFYTEHSIEQHRRFVKLNCNFFNFSIGKTNFENIRRFVEARKYKT